MNIEEEIKKLRNIHKVKSFSLLAERCETSADAPYRIKKACKIDFSCISGFPEFFKLSKKNPDIAFVGTTDSLVIYDLNDQCVVESYPIEYGARNVIEFKDSLFVYTFSGIKTISLNT